MGDMADEFIDHMFDRMLDNDDDDYDRPRRVPTCKHCGETDLTWRQEANGKRRLYYGGYPHRCPVTFEDET